MKRLVVAASGKFVSSCLTAASHQSVSVCVCLQGMSETFSTLHGLVNKGVNVVMDIPFELWNETSAEVADLKKQVSCYFASLFIVLCVL